MWAFFLALPWGDGLSYQHAYPGLLEGQEAAGWHGGGGGQSMGCRLGCPVGTGGGELQVGDPRSRSTLIPAHTGEGWAWSWALPSICVLHMGPVSLKFLL